MSNYRRALTHRALTEALRTRSRFDLPLNEHICVFDLAHALQLKVIFRHLTTKGFEGIYTPSIKHITLAPRRPSLRQRFTCAHEIGHHVFGHGQVSNCADVLSSQTNTRQEEFLANIFAAFVLMPKAAVLTAFHRLSTTPKSASPVDFYVAASTLGVGYSTLVQHCAIYFPQHLSRAHADRLLEKKGALPGVKADVLDGLIPTERLKRVTAYRVSESWTRPLDMVVASDIGQPSDIVKFDFDLISSEGLKQVATRCWQPVKEGSFDLRADNWSGKLRCYDPVKEGWWKVRIAGDE